MAEPWHGRTERGFDRLVLFSDAVVAIAITLLVLSLVDAVGDEPDDSALDFFRQNDGRLLAFVLSFAVIAMFWTLHHQLFEQVGTYSPALRWLNVLWLFTIVFLPVPTELLGVVGVDDTLTRALYVGSVLATSVVLLALTWLISRSPDLWRDPSASWPSLRVQMVTPLLLVVALIATVLVPRLGMGVMLLLVLGGPISDRLDRS